MNTIKILYWINKIALIITVFLYVCIIFPGMYAQFFLGIIQLLTGAFFAFNYKKLSTVIQRKIKKYFTFVIVYFAIFFLGSQFKNYNEALPVIIICYVFIIPMVVAFLFVIQLNKINSQNEGKNIFLTAYWKNLVMANYEVNLEVLKKYLPNGVELDYYQDKCYVSLVGFLFQNTKVLGVKIPFHVNFEEVNLRFYVKRNVDGVEKRGVAFIKEIVPKPAITWIANTFFKEKYETQKMRHHIESNIDFQNITYEWGNVFEKNIRIKTNNLNLPIELNSKEEFIAEHFLVMLKMALKPMNMK